MRERERDGATERECGIKAETKGRSGGTEISISEDYREREMERPIERGGGIRRERDGVR